MRIEICGSIGSGKTTLARNFSDMGLCLIEEDFKSNPFWSKFYQEPGKHIFETEVTFLLQHYHQIKTTEERDIVCDFSLVQDLAFAKLGLSGPKLEAFEYIYVECIRELGIPDLTIYLDCDIEVLYKRIMARERLEEKGISKDFLRALCERIMIEYSILPDTKRTTVKSDVVDFREFQSDSAIVKELMRFVDNITN